MIQGIERGKSKKPPRILVYGTEGVGKSTFAAGAPSPIFIPTEDGLGEIDCERFPLARSLKDVTQALGALIREKHDYRTVVIDSLDWLERLIFSSLCEEYNAKSIEMVAGGYGKGYMLAVQKWSEVVALLERLRNERAMNVLLIAHAKIERFEDPESVPYDRYSPRLHKYASSLLCEYADAVGFAHRRVRVQLDESGRRGIAKAIGEKGGDRVLRCVGGPSCVAKNRFRITDDLPLGWDSLFAEIEKSRKEN